MLLQGNRTVPGLLEPPCLHQALWLRGKLGRLCWLHVRVVGIHQSHKDIARSAIHLCNNSIQRRLKNDKERSPLLPCHNMWTSTRFQEYLQKRGRGGTWGSIIYPSMKRAVTNAMRVAQDHVEARKNSFELYGADFILGRDFKPWLIEINSSPTMHPSTPVTAQLCAQVQEDTIKVVVDRKLDRNCDIGNFELLWRQVRIAATLLRLPVSVHKVGGLGFLGGRYLILSHWVWGTQILFLGSGQRGPGFVQVCQEPESADLPQAQPPVCT